MNCHLLISATLATVVSLLSAPASGATPAAGVPRAFSPQDLKWLQDHKFSHIEGDRLLSDSEREQMHTVIHDPNLDETEKQDCVVSVFRIAMTRVKAAVSGNSPASGPKMSKGCLGLWRSYTFRAQGFSIQFSGKFEPNTSTDESHHLAQVWTYGQEIDNKSAYFVSAALQESDNGPAGFARASKALKESFKCAEFKSVPLSRIGPLASELSGDTCGADGHERVGAVVVQSGKWLYHAMYMIPLEADEADASDAIHFVRSFKLLPR